VIGDCRRDHDRGVLGDASRQITRQREIGVELQVRPVLHAGKAERDHDDRIRGQQSFRFGPADVLEQSPSITSGRLVRAM